MKFIPAMIAGAWILEMERHTDDRGWFARTWCAEEFAKHGLNPCIAQCGSSFNLRRGTLRGMHDQTPPHEEAKLVRCVRGTIFDVVLDLRQTSASFKKWQGVELTPENGLALYIPEGCAHGFQTLADNTEVHYQMSKPYHPESARVVRWDDPSFRIQWPLPDPFLSAKDGAAPDFVY